MPATSTPPPLAGALVLYTLARLALVGAVAGLLLLAGVPLVIALLVGLIVALPLAMVLFRPLRARLDAALIARAAERAALRARLRGEPVPRAEIEPMMDRSGEAREREADAGRG